MVTSLLKEQPRGLLYLFFTEMWERFSFYGMQALLILYMVSELMYTDHKATVTVGAYLALMYVTPFLGGVVADRLLGYRQTIIIGSVLMTLGHFSLAFSGSFYFYSGLSLLVCGCGLFKVNISALLGKFYADHDPRRDSGFTIFYMGINLGAIIAPLFCGYLGEKWGWHYGFALAGFGMLLGLAVFLSGIRYFEGQGEAPNVERLQKRVLGITLPHCVYVGITFTLLLVAFLLRYPEALDLAMPAIALFTISLLLYFSFWGPKKERGNVLTIMVLMFFHCCFWAFMDQAAMSLNLFTDRNVDRMWGNFLIPTTWFQMFNPLFIVLFAPLVSYLWAKLGKKSIDPDPSKKFALSLLLLAAGFAFIAFGTKFFDGSGKISAWFLIGGIFLQTLGEVCISPVGLSMVTRLAPKKFSGVFMGMWFVSISCADYLGGIIASAASVDLEGGIIDPLTSLFEYESLFSQIALFSFFAGIFLFVLSPYLKEAFVDEVEGEQETQVA